MYRPRRPRESPLFRLVEQHIEEFFRVYPERFAKQHGPLRPVVERVLRGFIKCGDLAHGFARAWCETCRLSYLIPYSCRGRSFCPSCEKKRSILWTEWLREEVLEPVPHRHVVLTMPRLLRPLFRKRRELLLDLSQCGAEALGEYMRREVGADTRPGIVVSIATSGDLLQWHVHLHILMTDGAFSDDGTFHPDPGRHRTLFYGYYASRVRGDRAAEEAGEGKVEEEPAKKRRCTASWARLIAQVAIKQILAHLGLSPPEEPKPPPAVHEVVRVPVDEEGREMEVP